MNANTSVLWAMLILNMLFTNCSMKKENPLHGRLAAKDSIVFQHPLIGQKSLHDNLTSFEEAISYSYVLISIFNTDCSKCISTLKKWQLFIDNNQEKDWNLNYLFLGYGNSPHFIDYVVDEKISFKYPIYFIHSNSNLIKINGHLHPYLDQSIIIRDQTEVIYAGDFLGDFGH